MWRSLVARFVRVEEVAGSSPATPTETKNRMAFTMRFLFIDYPKYGLADDLFFLVHRLEDVQQIFAVKDVLLATELAVDHRLPLMLKNPFQLLAP